MNVETQEMEAISVVAYESISVSEAIIVGIIVERITTWKVSPDGSATLVSIAEYRRLLGDYVSTDERIRERLQYLEAFCRNIIRPELQKIYEQGTKNVPH